MRDAARPTRKNLQPGSSRGGDPPAGSAQRLARFALGALLGLAACGSNDDAPGRLRLLDTPAELPVPLPFQALHVVVPDAPTRTATEPTTRTPSTAEVFWTATEPKSVQQLALDWGVKLEALTSLNPEITAKDTLAAGTKLRVYQYDPDAPPQSIGSPNKGKLKNGMPLPEGDAWRLRPVRRRAYGTQLTVGSLVQAFEAYGQQFPDGPKIRVGELAKRTGGRVSPHASHRSGRDVDIGYVFRGSDNGEDAWRYMNERNFDAEKNWYLIQEILNSGQVQTIYVSKKLQKLLHREAAKNLPEAELAALFEYPRTEQSPTAVIQHWKGHHNHMHVRFQCEPGNRRCRARGH
jgi:murein endopeptidase